jgi:hypothetical protein
MSLREMTQLRTASALRQRLPGAFPGTRGERQWTIWFTDVLRLLLYGRSQRHLSRKTALRPSWARFQKASGRELAVIAEQGFE